MPVPGLDSWDWHKTPRGSSTDFSSCDFITIPNQDVNTSPVCIPPTCRDSASPGLQTARSLPSQQLRRYDLTRATTQRRYALPPSFPASSSYLTLTSSLPWSLHYILSLTHSLTHNPLFALLFLLRHRYQPPRNRTLQAHSPRLHPAIYSLVTALSLPSILTRIPKAAKSVEIQPTTTSTLPYLT